MSVDSPSMLSALQAGGPAPDQADHMMTYGRFVGSWKGRVVLHQSGQAPFEAPAEVHFGWVLEGRAIQDVWIAPARDGEFVPEEPKHGRMYGTTLRVYNPAEDLWGITWIDPVNNVFLRMTGRPVGQEIVQEYQAEDGARGQWIFTDIKPDAFHWIGRFSKDGGETWVIRTEFFFQRRETPTAWPGST